MARQRVFTVDGTKVRELREKSGILQPALAAKVGIHQSSMSRIEAGLIAPNPDITLKIAEALGVTFEDITERIAS